MRKPTLKRKIIEYQLYIPGINSTSFARLNCDACYKNQYPHEMKNQTNFHNVNKIQACNTKKVLNFTDLHTHRTTGIVRENSTRTNESVFLDAIDVNHGD